MSFLYILFPGLAFNSSKALTTLCGLSFHNTQLHGTFLSFNTSMLSFVLYKSAAAAHSPIPILIHFFGTPIRWGKGLTIEEEEKNWKDYNTEGVAKHINSSNERTICEGISKAYHKHRNQCGNFRNLSGEQCLNPSRRSNSEWLQADWIIIDVGWVPG